MPLSDKDLRRLAEKNGQQDSTMHEGEKALVIVSLNALLFGIGMFALFHIFSK